MRNTGSKVNTRWWWCSVPQLGLTLYGRVDDTSTGSSVHGVLQARILEWVAVPVQGIFPTPGRSPGLLRGRWSLYCQATSEAKANVHASSSYDL